MILRLRIMILWFELQKFQAESEFCFFFQNPQHEQPHIVTFPVARLALKDYADHFLLFVY